MLVLICLAVLTVPALSAISDSGKSPNYAEENAQQIKSTVDNSRRVIGTKFIYEDHSQGPNYPPDDPPSPGFIMPPFTTTRFSKPPTTTFRPVHPIRPLSPNGSPDGRPKFIGGGPYIWHYESDTNTLDVMNPYYRYNFRLTEQ